MGTGLISGEGLGDGEGDSPFEPRGGGGGGGLFVEVVGEPSGLKSEDDDEDRRWWTSGRPFASPPDAARGLGLPALPGSSSSPFAIEWRLSFPLACTASCSNLERRFLTGRSDSASTSRSFMMVIVTSFLALLRREVECFSAPHYREMNAK